MATLKDGYIYSVVEGHQPLVYAVIQIPLLSLQRFRDFPDQKINMKCYLILRKLHRTRIFWK